MDVSTASRDLSDRATTAARQGVAACATAVVLAVFVYVNALDNPFIYDDHRLIVENPALADWSNWSAILWRDVTRPAVTFTYAIDRAIWGPGPFGFHLTSVLLHAVNVALVGLLAWRVSQDLQRRGLVSPAHVVAPVTALLFAVHPLLTQAVGYISGRAEVLCATFVLAAMVAARHALVTGRRLGLLAAVVCWALALAAKEPAVLFPVLLLVYDIVVLRGDVGLRRSRLWRMHLPLLATAAVLVAMRLTVFLVIEHRGDVDVQWTFALVELDVVRRYLSMLLVPTGQAIFHAVTPIGPGDVQALNGIAVVGLVAVLIWIRRHRSPLASFGLLWFLLLLVPSSALVVLDRGEPMAEHRVYLASIGVFLTIGVAAGQVAAVKPSGFMRTLGVMTMAALTLSLAGRTVLRNQLWASPTLVWLEAAERAPDHWLPALLLGEELHRTGRHGEAITAFQRAVAARPESRPALGNLGVCLLERGDAASAERAFATQKTLDPRSPEASNGLATVALARGAIDEARRGFLATLTFDPPNLAARRGLAVIAETVDRDPAEALRWCREIALIAPATPGNAECLSRNDANIGGGSNGGR